MASRMEPRNADELALETKLDITRTLVRLRKRIESREELDLLESRIRQSHKKEVSRGEVTQGHVPSNEDLLALFGEGQDALEAKNENDPALD